MIPLFPPCLPIKLGIDLLFHVWSSPVCVEASSSTPSMSFSMCMCFSLSVAPVVTPAAWKNMAIFPSLTLSFSFSAFLYEFHVCMIATVHLCMRFDEIYSMMAKREGEKEGHRSQRYRSSSLFSFQFNPWVQICFSLFLEQHQNSIRSTHSALFLPSSSTL